MAPLIRPAQPTDAAAVQQCVVASFQHYTPRIGKPPGPMLLDFAAEIAQGHVWLAECEAPGGAAAGTAADGGAAGGLVVGGALVLYETAQGFYIDTVAVLPGLQGSGVGKALLQFAEQEAIRRGHTSLYLATNAKMTENQVFYPHIGYVETGRQHDEGYDRVFYRKQLPGAAPAPPLPSPA